jgi:hypothetical protein
MTAKTPPKPSKDIIYIDVDDEITGIIDKIENSEHKVVALVLPKRTASLQSTVNMKLLARSAEAADKNPVLITSEAALMPLAGAAGLHVAKNLQSKPEIPDAPVGRVALATNEEESAETLEDSDEIADEENLPDKIDYDRPVGALAAAHEEGNEEAIDLDDEDEKPAKPEPKATKTPKDKKLNVPNFDRFRMLLILGVLGLIGLIVFIILAVSVLPKAKITIQTTSEPVAATFNLTASPTATAVDSAKSVIPAKLETKDQTGNQQVTATGQQNNGQKASGSVIMTAQDCDPPFSVPDSVSQGTGITTNGLSYITQSTATFSLSSASGSCVYYKTGSINITSIAAGSKYNTSLNNASVRSGVTADGSASGGTDSIVTVLSQSDVDGAKSKLTGGTTGSDFTKSFEDSLASQGEYVLTSTMKPGDPVITSSPSVGQPASNANVSVKITYSVLTVKKADLSQAIQDKLASQIDKSKQKLNGNFLNDANVTVQSQSAANAALLSIHEDTTAVPIIDVASVKKQAAGKKIGDIKSTIGNWPGVKNVDVSLGPFWVSKVPTKANKVTVILQEVKDSSSNSSAP